MATAPARSAGRLSARPWSPGADVAQGRGQAAGPADGRPGIGAGLGYVAAFALVAALMSRWRERRLPGHSVLVAPLLAAWGLGLGAHLSSAGMALVVEHAAHRDRRGRSTRHPGPAPTPSSSASGRRAPSNDPGATFEFGLARLLDGVDDLIASRRVGASEIGR